MRRSGIVGLVVLVVVGLAWWSLGKRGDRSRQTVALATRPLEPPAKREAFIGTRAPIKEPSPAGVTPECLAYWNNLRSLDTLTLFREGNQITIPMKPAACASVPPHMQESHERFLAYCKALLEMDPASVPKEAYEENRRGCAINLGIYRAQITEWLTRDTPLYEITDPKVLADKTIARYMENPGKAADAAERLLEVDPHNYPAAKISAMGRFLDARKPGTRLEGPAYDKIKERIAIAKELGVDDRTHLAELDYVVEAAHDGNLKRLGEKSDQLIKDDPKSGLPYYLKSCAAQHAGNRSEALILMAKAAATEPSNFRYRESLRLMETAPANENVQVCGAQLALPTELLLPN